MTTQLQQDFDAWWATTKPGESTQVGDLTYTMGTGGTATVTGPSGQTKTFTSTTNPASLATLPGVAQSYQQNYPSVSVTPPGGRAALDRDLAAFRSRLQPGHTESSAGFDYRVDEIGHIHVTTPSGQTYRFLPGSTPETIANHIPELAADWNKAYGTDFVVQPNSPTYFPNFVPQMQIGGVALKDMPPGSPERKRIDDLYEEVYGYRPMEIYDASSTGNWMSGIPQFNPNTVPGFQDVLTNRADNPFITQNQQIGGPFTPGPVGGGGGGGTGVAPPGWLGSALTAPFNVLGGAGSTAPGPGGPTGPAPWTGGTGGPGPIAPPDWSGGQGTGGLLHQANLGEVATFNPYTSDVQYDELVKNQMADALNTPYANLMRKRAEDEMNQRGLLSSTLVTQAAEQAALEAAMPIAQQDAATFFENRARANDAINRALEFNTTARNQMTQANMDALNAFGLDAQQFQNQMQATGAEHAQQMRLAEFDRDTRERLTQMTINSDEYLKMAALNQQDREFVIKTAAANNEYIMGAITNIQKIEGLSDDQRAQLMDEVGAIHYANLMMLQSLTGATINWNTLGTGNSVVAPSNENAENPVVPEGNQYEDRYAGFGDL